MYEVGVGEAGESNGSGRTNRLAPDGSLHAVTDRGLLWGNRGALLDAQGRPARHSRGRGWVICVLEFHGRHRTQWLPNRLTELYLLDEVTGLAAGHRPCGECRHADHVRFRRAWEQAHPGDPVGARAIDSRLHDDRLEPPRREQTTRHRTHGAELADLPDGVMVVRDDGWWLRWAGRMWRWSFRGYREPRDVAEFPTTVEVLTPRSTVAALRAGFVPAVHPSAGAAR